eukprot:g35466.t1
MENKELVEELNRYLASVFTVEDTRSIPELQESQGAEMSVVGITKEKVLGKLKDLRVDRYPGPDGLHSRVLKKTAGEIVEILVVIFQESRESGSFLEDRKITNITPLFKRRKTGNYMLERCAGIGGGPKDFHKNDLRNERLV